MPVDPITLQYLVTVAWGLSTSFLSKFKVRMRAKQQSAAKNDEKDVDYVNDVEEVKHAGGRSRGAAHRWLRDSGW